MLETTCLVTSGESGGPVVTLDGKVIGITLQSFGAKEKTAASGKPGAKEKVPLGSYVLPINELKPYLDQPETPFDPSQVIGHGSSLSEFILNTYGEFPALLDDEKALRAVASSSSAGLKAQMKALTDKLKAPVGAADNPNRIYLLAYLDDLSGDSASAERRLEGLTRVFPRYAAGHLLLGRILARGAAAINSNPELQKERYTLAKGQYRQAIDYDPNLSYAHRELGGVLMALEEYDPAIEELQKANDQNDSDPEAHLLLGRALLKTGLAGHAKKDLEIAASQLQGPLRADALFDLASANCSLAKAYEMQTGDALHPHASEDAKIEWNACVANLQRATALGYKDPQAYSLLGYAYERTHESASAADAYLQALQGGLKDANVAIETAQIYAKSQRWEDAAAAYRIAAKLRSDDAAIFVELGRCLANQGKEDEANDAFTAAIRIDPDAAGAQAGLGAVLLREKRYRGAVDALRKASQDDPNALDVQELLGEALFYSGDVPSALDAFNRYLTRSPESVPARVFRMKCQIALGQNAAALAEAGRILESAPDNAEAVCLQGQALFRLNRLLEAKKSLQRAGELGYASPDLPLYLGQVLFAIAQPLSDPNRYAEAIRQLETSERAGGQSVDLYRTLAQIYVDLDQPDSAVKALDQARTLDPESEAVFRLYGATWTLKGDFNRAKESYLEALKRDPKDGAAHLGLSRALVELGRPEEAEAEAAKALDTAQGMRFHAEMAYIYLHLGPRRRGDAGTEIAQALRLAPRDPLPRSIEILYSVVAEGKSESQKKIDAYLLDFPTSAAFSRLLDRFGSLPPDLLYDFGELCVKPHRVQALAILERLRTLNAELAERLRKDLDR
jgi:tetratricopeptide (TPR) repeat protein